MIYLARRNPVLAAEDYAQAWREHSALGSSCRSVGLRVRAVAQCSRVLDAALQGAADDYDGVNLMWLKDREAATAIWSDPEVLAVMRPDEPRVFSTYVREVSLVCRELVLRDVPRSSVVLHGFLRRQGALSAADFQLAWMACNPGQQLLMGPLSQAGRVVYNEVVDTPPPGYEFDAIVEWWFDSVEDVSEAFACSDLREQLSAPLAKLFDLDRSVFMLTRVTHSKP